MCGHQVLGPPRVRSPVIKRDSLGAAGRSKAPVTKDIDLIDHARGTGHGLGECRAGSRVLGHRSWLTLVPARRRFHSGLPEAQHEKAR